MAWYTSIAPGSWLIYKDVVEGRDEFNFSNWQEQSEKYKKLAEVINEGVMPPPQYLLLHPDARLSAPEKQQFLAGLEKASNRPVAEGRCRRRHRSSAPCQSGAHLGELNRIS